MVKLNDVVSIKNAIDSELTRRSKTKPANNDIASAVNSKVAAADLNKYFTAIKVMDSSKAKTITAGSAVKTNNYTESVEYLQTLMVQNVKG